MFLEPKFYCKSHEIKVYCGLAELKKLSAHIHKQGGGSIQYNSFLAHAINSLQLKTLDQMCAKIALVVVGCLQTVKELLFKKKEF